MSNDAKLSIDAPRWLVEKLEQRARELGVPVEGLARSILESGVLGIGSGSPAPTPAPPTIHNPQPSGAPPSPAPPTIHNPQPSGAPPSPAPPTIHHPASGRTVGWRELTVDHRQSCAQCGKEIPGGGHAHVAMDDTGVFRTTICPACFVERTKS